MSEFNVHSLLAARRNLADRYMSDATRDLTYRDANTIVDHLTEALLTMGAGKQHVGLVSENDVNYVLCYWSLLQSGCVIVPIAPNAPDAEILSQLAYTDCSWLVSHGNHLPFGKRVSEALSLGLIHMDGTEAQSIRQPRVQHGFLAASGTAIMIHTSGSTSAPKRVMLSHRALVRNVRMHNEVARLSHADRTVICLPIEFGYAQGTQLLNATLAGASIHLRRDRHFDPSAFLITCLEERPTFLTVVPSLLRLVGLTLKPNDVRLGTVRVIYSGGSPLSKETRQLWNEMAPQIRLLNTYGMTECGPRITGGDLETVVDVTVGRALNGVSLRIERLANQHGPGEIQVKTKSIMSGYYRRPAETKAAFTEDGWFKTGDIGHIDANGRLVLSGRVKNVVIIGGMNVYCEDIEEAVLGVDGVLEARAYGVPLDDAEEELGLDVVQDKMQKLNANLIRVALSKRLSAHKLPSVIRFVDNIKKTDNGKIVR